MLLVGTATLLLAALSPSPTPRSGRGRYAPPAGRGGRGGGTGRGRYTPPGRSANDAPSKQQQRDLDIFGPAGEWRARKGQREMSAYREREAAAEEAAAEQAEDPRLVSVADFAPKIWRAEAGGGKNVSFFSRAPTFATLGASEEIQAALA